ncbi:MAG: putative selenium-dependent hydroxylase accessory protein YqeC [Caldilineaceae bacterium]|nr:putative selenium-dependent hydroxylase accessory protein YqeC [Caldilineaceae bacterium]
MLASHGYGLLTGPVVGDRRLGVEAAVVDALYAAAADLGIAAITVEADGSKMRPVKAPAAHEPVLPATTSVLVPAMGIDALGAPIDAVHVHRPDRVRAVLGLATETAERLTPAQAAQLLIAREGGAKGLAPPMRLLPLLNKADTPLRLVLGRLVAELLARQGHASLLAKVGDTHGEPVVERWGPVAAVVMAAGASTRMGRPKQVEPVEGVPMVVRALQTALAAGVSKVVVVTGAYREMVDAAVAPLRAQAGSRLQVIDNPGWQAGQATSMHAGLRACGAEIQAALFLPADQPFLAVQLLRQLMAAWRSGAPIAAPRAGGVLRGAPAIFDRELWPELLAVRGDVGGRAVLARRHELVRAVPAPASWLRDIDSPSDLTDS